MNTRIEKWTTFTDDKGVSQRINLTRQAWQNVLDELGNRWSAFKEKFQKDNPEQLAEYLKGEEEAARRRMEFEAEAYQRRLQYNEDIARRNLDQNARMLGAEEQRAGIDRDARLRVVEATDAQTLKQKIGVEQQKAQIEVDYLARVHDVKMRLFDLETSRMLLEEEANMNRLGYRADEIKACIAELTQQRDEIRQVNQEAPMPPSMPRARTPQTARRLWCVTIIGNFLTHSSGKPKVFSTRCSPSRSPSGPPSATR